MTSSTTYPSDDALHNHFFLTYPFCILHLAHCIRGFLPQACLLYAAWHCHRHGCSLRRGERRRLKESAYCVRDGRHPNRHQRSSATKILKLDSSKFRRHLENNSVGASPSILDTLSERPSLLSSGSHWARTGRCNQATDAKRPAIRSNPKQLYPSPCTKSSTILLYHYLLKPSIHSLSH